MSKLETIDRTLSIFGKALHMAILLAGILVCGFVAYLVLGLMDYGGFMRWAGAIAFGLIGGVIFALIIRILAWLGVG